MRAATQVFDMLASERDATPALIAEAASAFGTLGDELDRPGTPSLGDLAVAVTAYRRNLELDERALHLDPNFARARRGLAIVPVKIANLEIETDPAQAVADYQLAEQRFETLLESRQDSLSALRMRANLVRHKVPALRELGEYAQAIPLFAQAVAIQKRISSADPKDNRSLFDLYVDLTQEGCDCECQPPRAGDGGKHK